MEHSMSCMYKQYMLNTVEESIELYLERHFYMNMDVEL